MLEGDYGPTSAFAGLALPPESNFANPRNFQCQYNDPIASRPTSQYKSVRAEFYAARYTVTSIYETGSVVALNEADLASETSLNKMLI